MPVKPLIVGTRPVPSVRRQASTHRFAVGQAVRLKGGFAGKLPPAAISYITRVLPPLGNTPQYRVRNDEERHERVCLQDDLELADAPLFHPASIERIFGHG